MTRDYIYRYLPFDRTDSRLTIFAIVFLVLFNTQIKIIEPTHGFGVIKFTLCAISCAMLITVNLRATKAVLIGLIYVSYQLLQASFFPETFRWSTVLFSMLLVGTYINFYNLVYVKEVFTIDRFIRLLKWIMMAFFVVCVAQQVCLLLGIHYLPILNITRYLNRGIGCDSLSMEPSTFARMMLACYYIYVKCCEYRRGEGPFSLTQLFAGEHKWVTVRFLWMMLTMGSGTAFVCLILFSLYFVRKNNWFYVVPLMVMIYLILPLLPFEQLQRATSAIELTSNLDVGGLREADSSAASRLAPVINSVNADFTDVSNWFGHGIDKSPGIYEGTMFYSYGLILLLIAWLLDFSCAYHFLSLATLFMFAGVGGGAGTNIYYAWGIMMLYTVQRYFHDKMRDEECAMSHRSMSQRCHRGQEEQRAIIAQEREIR